MPCGHMPRDDWSIIHAAIVNYCCNTLTASLPSFLPPSLPPSLLLSVDLSGIEGGVFLGPFIDVIRSDVSTGPIMIAALSALGKFLKYDAIGVHPYTDLCMHTYTDMHVHLVIACELVCAFKD